MDDIKDGAEFAAESVTIQGLTYTKQEHTYMVTKAEESISQCIIPAKIHGIPVASIGDSAFCWCCLTSITIPNSVISIGNSAFSFSGLTSITIPNSVTSIGKSAFCCCSNLASVTLPNSVISIGERAFDGCSSLISITIPNSVTCIGSKSFYDCRRLERIVVDINNKRYHSVNNCLIETATKTLVLGCKNSVIPLDGSVTSIGSAAFYGCACLSSILIPDSIVSIEDGAFGDCGSITSISIPNGVACIKKYTFFECTKLMIITIPNSVKSIEKHSFYDCSNLTAITFLGTKAQWQAISKDYGWNSNIGKYTVFCTDGEIL